MTGSRAGHRGPHPEPSPNFSSRSLPIKSFRVEWYRIYRCALDPLFFGRTGSYRFDAPAGEFGVLYVARSRAGAFIEVFGDAARTTAGRNTLDRKALGLRCWGRVHTSRPMRLVDLTGRGLARLGADERLCSGGYDVAQRWARAIYLHPSQPDGIYYRARHDPSQRSVALFDRAEPDVQIQRDGTLLTDAVLLAQLLRRYHIGLID